jgi:hypothetical protein
MEKHGIDVVELKQPLTPRMKTIQLAIIEVMDACISELRRSNSSVSGILNYRHWKGLDAYHDLD